MQACQFFKLVYKIFLFVLPTESKDEKNKDETDNKDPVSDVPENSVSVIEASRQPCNNRYIIS